MARFIISVFSVNGVDAINRLDCLTKTSSWSQFVTSDNNLRIIDSYIITKQEKAQTAATHLPDAFVTVEGYLIHCERLVWEVSLELKAGKDYYRTLYSAYLNYAARNDFMLTVAKCHI